MQFDGETCITVGEACRILEVSESHVYRLLRTKKLRAVNSPAGLVISVSSLRDIQRRQYVTTQAKLQRLAATLATLTTGGEEQA